MAQLSSATKAYLDGICFASNFCWTEGGMSYEEATPESEIDLAGKVRERIFSETTESFYAADHSELTKLTRFLHGAFGHNLDFPTKYLPISTVSEGLLRRINLDLQADWFTAELEEDSYGMDLQLLFADEQDRPICVLKLSWQID